MSDDGWSYTEKKFVDPRKYEHKKAELALKVLIAHAKVPGSVPVSLVKPAFAVLRRYLEDESDK